MAKRIRYGSKEYWQQKDRIYKRDRGRCQSPHCKATPDWFLNDKKWALDHIVPLCKGGTNDDSNMRVLCEFCHLARDDRNFKPNHFNSHERLAKKYIRTGRVRKKDLERYRWQG